MAITKVDLANVVTGVLPVANGGTGTSTGVAPGGSDRQVQFNNAGAFGGNSGFVYDSSGNLGLGVTPSAGSGRPNFNIGYAGTGLVGSQADLSLVSSAYYGGSWKRAEATYKPSRLDISDGIFTWQNAAAGAVDSAISWTTAMTLDANGNLGLGITSPGGNANDRQFTIKGTTGQLTLNNGSQGTNVGINSSSIGYLEITGANPLAFYTNGSERMRIDSSGNVGIGTSSPTPYNAGATLLQVNSGTVNSEVKITNSTTGTGATAGLAIVQSGTTAYFWNGSNGSIGFGTNNTQQAAITSAGLMQFNSGYGSVATAYGCRVWVSFTASSGAIRGSGNVSSVTRNGTGDYTVNFTNAMPDANYAFTTALKPASNQGSTNGKVANVRYDTTPTTTACRLWCYSTAGVEDFDIISLVVFR